jgi:hypothetical protein
MVMLDLFHLPERENKFNQNPFPHYLMLEKTDDPRVWQVNDPDFRWEGPHRARQDPRRDPPADRGRRLPLRPPRSPPPLRMPTCATTSSPATSPHAQPAGRRRAPYRSAPISTAGTA